MSESIFRSVCMIIFSGMVFLAGNALAEQKVLFSIGEWEPFVGETMVNYGPTAEIIKTACKKAGYTPEFEFAPWKRAYKNVKTGKSVATFPWAWTEEREIEVLFPKTPIMISKERVFFLKDKFPKGIEATKIEQLKPYKMVGILGYWYEEPAKKAGINIHLVSKAPLAWKMLGKGRVDILFENELVARTDMKNIFGDSMDRFSCTEEPFKTAKMFCLFSRIHPDSPKIMKKIDQALKEMSESREIERILNDYVE